MSKKIYVDSKEYYFNELRDLRDIFKANNIIVSDHVEIGDGCNFKHDIVLETAAKIGDEVIIHENVRIGADARIDDFCEIFNNVTVQTCAKIGKYVRIGATNTIGEEAKVDDHTTLLHSFFIQGTLHPVTYVGNHKISIGCVCETINNWKKEKVEIGNKHKYSAQAIQEYIEYVEKIEKLLEDNNDRFDL